MVSPADSTLVAIRKKVRRLTASSSESELPTATIDEYINTFYNNDFPYSIKLDQMRSVYTFFTTPNVDKYPLNVNYNQGVRDPVYFEGIQGSFFKDRNAFYTMWPRWPTKHTESSGLDGVITGATQANPCVITSVAHGLISGDVVTISNVGGMTQLNGNTYTVTVLTANTFSLNVDSTAFGAYTSGGTWTGSTRLLSFTVGTTPILRNEITIGGTDQSGANISVMDDGYGNLYQCVPNPVTSVPTYTTNVPGMKNLNTGNPGDLVKTQIGTVNYITGAMSFTLSQPPQIGSELTVWVSWYNTGRPYTLLFWNNEFTVRPVPDNVYKVEVETYLTPVQFMATTDSPILTQWWQYIAIGAAILILQDRQDMEGLENLIPLFDRQEALVLERQGIEEIGQRNSTIFSSVVRGPEFGSPGGWYY